MGLGLLIPFLLIEHLAATILLPQRHNIDLNYEYMLLATFADGWRPFVQVLLLGVAWGHGCIGLHFWLRFRPLYQRVSALLRAVALILPVLAGISFFQNGLELKIQVETDPGYRLQAEERRVIPRDPAAVHRDVSTMRTGGIAIFAGLLALTLAARLARYGWETRRGRVTVHFPGNRVVKAPCGGTLLEISRDAGVALASVCGGRGRCSTCRVRIAGGEKLTAPDQNEVKVLRRVDAPPGVRLACQIVPKGEMQVTPLLPPAIRAGEVAASGTMAGQDMVMTLLFADLRGFTSLSEQKLPYDVVFILNRYFAEMGQAIEQVGGRLVQFSGDGIMALFGLNAMSESRQAHASLTAAREMLARLDLLNHDLRHDLGQPLRMGIGLHQGHCIVGEMGYSNAFGLTAIGDTVNTASRLESMTKEMGALVIFSDTVAQAAKLSCDTLSTAEIQVRGRQKPLTVHLVRTAAEMPVTGSSAG
jgi:adenylate cyclase